MDRDKARRDKTYRWEGKWRDWVHDTMSLRECRAVVHWACEKYGVVPPRVRQHKGRSYSWSDGDTISFQVGQRNAAVALHEAAHHIHGACCAPGLDHCQQWLGIYVWLLEGYRIAPRMALWGSLRAARLRWTKTTKVSPSRIGKRKGPAS